MSDFPARIDSMKAIPNLALVTGGAQRVGRMIALELARLGWSVVVHYHTSAIAVQDTTSSILAGGGWASAEQADLSQPEQIEGLFTRVKNTGNLKLLVNAAAVMKPANLKTVSSREFDEIFDLNLRAPLLCSRYAYQQMDHGGQIIHISDAFAWQTWHTNTLYGLSKAALEHLTRMQAAAYQPKVRVNAIAPAYVLKPEPLSEQEWEKRLQKADRMPVTPIAFREAIKMICSQEDINGEVIQLPGGDQLIHENKR